MIHSFKSLLPARVDFGPGKIQGLADIVKGKTVLLLSDQGSQTVWHHRPGLRPLC